MRDAAGFFKNDEASTGFGGARIGGALPGGRSLGPRGRGMHGVPPGGAEGVETTRGELVGVRLGGGSLRGSAEGSTSITEVVADAAAPADGRVDSSTLSSGCPLLNGASVVDPVEGLLGVGVSAAAVAAAVATDGNSEVALWSSGVAGVAVCWGCEAMVCSWAADVEWALPPVWVGEMRLTGVAGAVSSVGATAESPLLGGASWGGSLRSSLRSSMEPATGNGCGALANPAKPFHLVGGVGGTYPGTAWPNFCVHALAQGAAKGAERDCGGTVVARKVVGAVLYCAGAAGAEPTARGDEALPVAGELVWLASSMSWSTWKTGVLGVNDESAP